MHSLGTRLKKALDDSGVTQAQLAEHIGISQQAVQFICSGKTKHTKHLDRIAAYLGVTPEWLAFGTTNQIAEGSAAYNSTQEKIPVFTLRQIERGQPAGNEIICPFPHGPGTFAFSIEGDPTVANPMQPSYGRAYPVGSIVFADPSQAETCESGDIVIAELKNRSDKVIAFRQLYREAGGEALLPLNPQFPQTLEPFTVTAKVIGAILP